MGIERETAEVLFNAFLASYDAVYGPQFRHKCERLGRCVYDEACPNVEDCMPSDYVE